jgi:fumarate reductase subunit D
VVPLIGRRAHGGHRLEAPLVAFRAAVAALPTRDDAVVDRLFALECLARAGRDARAERNELLSARRAAEDYIEDGWEPDVPHANVLGQALSTVAALDDDPPSDWPQRLDETVDALAARQTRHGVTTTPLVLASVIRGVTTSARPVPNWLLDGARAYFEAGPTAAASAELAEALSRHRSGAQLAAQATEIVFSDRHGSDPGVSIARWWLAERLDGAVVAGAEKVAAARAQAITTPPPGDVRLAAMLAEVTGRAVETLVLLPESELELLRARSRGRSLIENYAWRTAAVIAPLILAFVYLRTVLGWFGNHHPSTRTLSGLAFVLTALVGVVVTIAGWHAAKRLERDLGLFGVVMSIAVPLVPAALVYFLYPG